MKKIMMMTVVMLGFLSCGLFADIAISSVDELLVAFGEKEGIVNYLPVSDDYRERQQVVENTRNIAYQNLSQYFPDALPVINAPDAPKKPWFWKNKTSDDNVPAHVHAGIKALQIGRAIIEHNYPDFNITAEGGRMLHKVNNLELRFETDRKVSREEGQQILGGVLMTWMREIVKNEELLGHFSSPISLNSFSLTFVFGDYETKVSEADIIKDENHNIGMLFNLGQYAVQCVLRSEQDTDVVLTPQWLDTMTINPEAL
jgi:hypothetical protein